MNVQYPMLFELQNPNTSQLTHCGVLEFTAEEGIVYIPYWMMQLLFLEEGDFIHVRNVTLPRATYVKLQPHETAFIDIANPKAVLEIAFRNFSCLTRGDVIQVQYNDRKYDLNVIDVKPNTYGAVSIVETDVQLDFAPPVDYVEPPKPAVAAAAVASAAVTSAASSSVSSSSSVAVAAASTSAATTAADVPAGKRLRSESGASDASGGSGVFTGTGYVLNSKAAGAASSRTSSQTSVSFASSKPKRFRTTLVNGALVREEIKDSDDEDDDGDDDDTSSSDDGAAARAAAAAASAATPNHFASLQGGHVLRQAKKK